jgi:hypothetical protein
MPGMGSSFGGGTETTSFGGWDQGANEPYYPIQLELDCRPNAGLQNPPYTRALAPDARGEDRRQYYQQQYQAVTGFQSSPLEFGGEMYDLGELRPPVYVPTQTKRRP